MLGHVRVCSGMLGRAGSVLGSCWACWGDGWGVEKQNSVRGYCACVLCVTVPVRRSPVCMACLLLSCAVQCCAVLGCAVLCRAVWMCTHRRPHAIGQISRES